MSDVKEYHGSNPGKRSGMGHNAGGGAVYGMGFIGAAIYFIMHSTSFWGGVLGFFKAIVWPVLLVFKAFEFMKM